MKVEATFPNPGSYLRPGQFARSRVAVAEKRTRYLFRSERPGTSRAKTVMVVDQENKVAVRTSSSATRLTRTWSCSMDSTPANA